MCVCVRALSSTGAQGAHFRAQNEHWKSSTQALAGSTVILWGSVEHEGSMEALRTQQAHFKGLNLSTGAQQEYTGLNKGTEMLN